MILGRRYWLELGLGFGLGLGLGSGLGLANLARRSRPDARADVLLLAQLRAERRQLHGRAEPEGHKALGLGLGLGLKVTRRVFKLEPAEGSGNTRAARRGLSSRRSRARAQARGQARGQAL